MPGAWILLDEHEVKVGVTVPHGADYHYTNKAEQGKKALGARRLLDEQGVEIGIAALGPFANAEAYKDQGTDSARIFFQHRSFITHRLSAQKQSKRL